ncbi:MAG TPA: EboA domain-containing protein [Arenibacter sp.]|nr:EboA domain-containing protein [Arenibacter sp.]
MLFKKVGEQLSTLLKENLTDGEYQWLFSKLDQIISGESVKELYLTYSLIPSKIGAVNALLIEISDGELKEYLLRQEANIWQLARIFLLVRVLEEKPEFFRPKVANIIQVADTGELETFLKFLVLLPDPENYRSQAVEALRTNIGTVFNAVALHNPYPALYFNDQQWNQMYLKAAFMQQDLMGILSVDQRANKDLVRIISDYAHERWAASREIDPYFWRPVSQFLDGQLIGDMEKLFQSDNVLEKRAAALCCHASPFPGAKVLLNKYPELKREIDKGGLDWESLRSGIS